MDIGLSFKGRPVSGFDWLLDAYGDAELDSPARSTVPLLAYWRRPGEPLARFRDALRLQPEASPRLAFEHLVPVRQGRGKA